MKRTIAILGENAEQKIEIAFGLAHASYPVVLQVEIEQERRVKKIISKRRVNLSIATHTNSFSCAWEADVIIIVANKDKLRILAKEIENYITGKIIIILLKESALSSEVNSLLRYAKNVFVNNSGFAIDTDKTSNGKTLDFFIAYDFAAPSKMGSQMADDTGYNSMAVSKDRATKLVNEIKCLLDVFY